MPSLKEHLLNFNIDTHLNPIVPSNQLKHLPPSISHWLGYRSKPQKPPSKLVAQAYACIGTLVGLLIVGAMYNYAPGINKFNPPVIIASLGASAILEYNAIETPLSQPRNAVLGHGICAIIGVAISRAFQESSDFQNLRWVAGALACALGCLATGLTNTIHPPGGATAVLAAVDPSIIAMGWWFVPVILVGMSVMLCIAFLVNNIARQYPVYWWSPAETGSAYKKDKPADEERADEKSDGGDEQHEEHDDSQSDTTLKHIDSHKAMNGIFVSADQVVLPPDINFSFEETHIFELLQSKLRAHERAHS